MVKYYLISGVEGAAQRLADSLSQKLSKGEKLLWVVSGGSSVKLAVATRRALNKSLLEGLTVTLADERYGNADHPDSNWRELTLAGFDFSGLKTVPVLRNLDLKQTVQQFNTNLKQLLESTQSIIGLFGLGADGHTAGLLPASPALTSTNLAEGYRGPDFTRITITPAFMAKINEAYIYAMGSNKWPVLDTFETAVSSTSQPAQILKKIPHLVIFNDYRGDKL